MTRAGRRYFQLGLEPSVVQGIVRCSSRRWRIMGGITVLADGRMPVRRALSQGCARPSRVELYYLDDGREVVVDLLHAL